MNLVSYIFISDMGMSQYDYNSKTRMLKELQQLVVPLLSQLTLHSSASRVIFFSFLLFFSSLRPLNSLIKSKVNQDEIDKIQGNPGHFQCEDKPRSCWQCARRSRRRKAMCKMRALCGSAKGLTGHRAYVMLNNENCHRFCPHQQNRI